MAQDFQLISAGFAKEPFNRKVSILDLDSLDGPAAVEFLSDIFADLEPGQKRSLDDETPQESAVRIFTFLRVIRYPSPENPEEKSVWRQEVIEGHRRTVLAILLWIVQNITTIQQRLYIARFMTRVDIPAEIRADSEINALYEEQENAIIQFAAVHKQYAQLKTNADDVENIRKEIRDLRAQKEQAERRVAELLVRVREIPGKPQDKENRMVLAKILREERDIAVQLGNKRLELMHLAPIQTDQINRLRDYTSKITDDWLDMTPEKLIKRLEDRLTIQRRAVQDVLPKAIAQEKIVVAELQDLLGQTDFNERSLNELRVKAQMLQTEVFNLSDKLRSVSNSPAQVQLKLYRSQFEASENRKRDLALRNDMLYKEVRELEKRVKQRRRGSGDNVDAASLSLTISRNIDEKERKMQIITALQAEKSIMTRTQAILNAENDRIETVLSEWERRTGESPFKHTSAAAAIDSTSHVKLDAASLMNNIRELEKRIANKKSDISALLTDLQPIREARKVQQDQTNAERDKFQTEMKRFSGPLEQLENESAQLRSEVSEMEDKLFKNQYELQYADILLKRAEENKKSETTTKSLQRGIETETSKLAELQQQQENLKVSRAEKNHQYSAWRDLNQLFDMKIENVQRDLEKLEAETQNRTSTSNTGRDRIVMS